MCYLYTWKEVKFVVARKWTVSCLELEQAAISTQMTDEMDLMK